ncbi:hypothetical protein GOP47_0029649 [Adiantum capillus-veneris]|nr:hypothetical protein GOP47_0029649 [Adiantum capillus-veneris]
MVVMTPNFKHAQLTGTESILLRKGPFDAKDELESNLFESFKNLQMQLKPPYQLHSHSEAGLVQLNQALLYGILTQPQSQQLYIMHLLAVTRDGYAGFVSIISRLVQESYLKLLDQPRQQLFWLVRQLISLTAAEVDTLCICLLRRIVGGDISHWNIWLAGQMLDVLRSNWSWLVERSALITGALFTFLRLLPDHFMSKSPIVSELRQDEVTFCVKILRDHFQDCLVIGRDLVRLLQDVACIPEFESVWRDLLSNPAAFNAVGFADIAQLYVVRTPARYLTSRLTPEMEAQIRFMLTHVRMGSQQRYQAWFAQHFLTSSGSETLVCDLIRYICCVYHPTNQILQSDIVPRWAILGWLLKCCKSQHVEANAKLALFYDWLFFMRNTDGLMNVEPALLLMVYSIPKYTDITQSLLEFLFSCMEYYDPQRKDLILCGVTASVDILIEKGVVQSLKPLFSSPHLALSLRKKLKEYFSIYCHEVLNEAKGEISPKDMSKLGLQSVLGAQVTVSKKIKGPNVADANVVVGGESIEGRETVLGVVGQGNKDSQDDAMGSLIGKKRNIDVEDAGSCRGHEKVKGLEMAVGESIGDIDLVSHKTRCIDVVTLDDLSKALQGLHDEAFVVFEKFLLFHLSDLEAIDAQSSLKELPTCGAENYEVLAKRVSSIIRGSKFGFFAPLHGHSLDSFETDEIMSVTSVVLCMYTHSTHPRLLQMLLSWHAEGYAVGARLLCYSCRLAEDIAPSNTSAILDLKAEGAIQSPQKHVKKLDTLPGKRRKVSTLSALSWHQGLIDIADQNLDGDQKALKLVGPAQAHSSVTASFMAYKEFLRGLKNNGEQPVSVNGKHARTLTENELQPLFVKDLETCLAWSIPRLHSILPFVFNYLPELSEGNEQVIKLLVSTVDPVEMSKLEVKLSLKETSVFGASLGRVHTIVKSSLLWDCFEQQYLWRLLIAEWQNPTSPSLSEFLESCALFLLPEQHGEALSGLLSLLKMNHPTTHLVSTMLFLPQDFNKLVAAVLAAWTSIDSSRFLECLTGCVTKSLKDKVRHPKNSLQHLPLPLMDNSMCSALSTYMRFLDNSLACTNPYTEQTQVELRQIRNTLLKLAENLNSEPATNASVTSALK